MTNDEMYVLTGSGVEAASVPQESDRSTVGRHWNSIRKFLQTGDSEPLAEFEGHSINGRPLETDPDVIEEWWRRRELDFLDIYL